MTLIDRYAALRQTLEDRVLRGPGATAPSLRQAAAARASLPASLAALVDRIHDHAYRVTDEEIAAAERELGADRLFEVVVAAAIGAARERLDAGLRALEQA